jgi:hypothetical protein
VCFESAHSTGVTGAFSKSADPKELREKTCCQNENASKDAGATQHGTRDYSRKTVRCEALFVKRKGKNGRGKRKKSGMSGPTVAFLISSNSLNQYDVVGRPFETVLAYFAVGGTVVPSSRLGGAWELDDYTAFRCSPFEIFMLAVNSKKLGVMPGESRRDFL